MNSETQNPVLKCKCTHCVDCVSPPLMYRDCKEIKHSSVLNISSSATEIYTKQLLSHILLLNVYKRFSFTKFSTLQIKSINALYEHVLTIIEFSVIMAPMTNIIPPNINQLHRGGDNTFSIYKLLTIYLINPFKLLQSVIIYIHSK